MTQEPGTQEPGTEVAGSEDVAEKLLRLLGGKWLAAAISAAASLGLSDALAAQSLSLDELAARVSCQPDALSRLMRVLLGEEIVVLDEQHLVFIEGW